MSRKPKNLAILGSTGSIGRQTLDVVRSFPDDFRVIGLAANRSLALLEEQVREFRPRLVCCNGTDDEKAPLLAAGCEESSLEAMACDPEVDLVVTATVGDVALPPTLAAIRAGKDIALANKETVVMAGQTLMTLAREHDAAILPVDSEPSAIWQCMRGEGREVSKLYITASGGAFRHTPLADLATVTPEQALAHPTWRMGPKITVDSATLMNKAFEVIEAHWLFDVPWDAIDVVIHPQSIIHSMVEFVDGSVKAQISPPDMHLPIQYAMFYPDRVYNSAIRSFDPVGTGALTFEQWDDERFPCFGMALDVAKRGGTWPAALAGADDAAVQRFLEGRIGFLDIGAVIREALSGHRNAGEPTVEQIMDAAQSARRRVDAAVGV